MLNHRHSRVSFSPTVFPISLTGIDFAIQAEKDYRFNRLEVNGVKVDVEDSPAAGALIYGFTLQSNMTAVAYFDAATIYTVSVQAEPAEGGTVTGPGGGKVEVGQSTTVTATPKEGYTFVG